MSDENNDGNVLLKISEIDGKIESAISKIRALETQRTEIISEIGKKALIFCRENPDIAFLAAKADENDNLRDELSGTIETIRKEKSERIAKLTCNKCRKVNSDESMFCEECGHKLGEIPREYCNTCGKMNMQDMKFCGECGTKLGEMQA